MSRPDSCRVSVPNGQFPAVSVVSPAGDWIRAGRKTLEVRQWQPDSLPLRDLVIVQNVFRLRSSGPTEDPNGRAVAIVDVESADEWRADQVAEACASHWEPGWLAWRLTNVRPVDLERTVPARLRIYTVSLERP
jgi:hypothetical protein